MIPITLQNVSKGYLVIKAEYNIGQILIGLSPHMNILGGDVKHPSTIGSDIIEPQFKKAKANLNERSPMNIKNKS